MPSLRLLMLILILCSALEFYKCFLLSSLGWFVMEIASRSNEFLSQLGDFAFGFLFLGSFSQALNALGLLFMFAFGFKFLKYRSQSKGFIPLASKMRTAIVSRRPKLRIAEENGNEEEEEEKECDGEKEEPNVKTLRKMVKSERRRRKKAVAELEKERMAAATAAEEAMAMILRLQREKSVIEMQANQDRRMAEQREQYDHQVIRYLERIAMDYEQKSRGEKLETGAEEGESEEVEDNSDKSFLTTTMEDLEDEADDTFFRKIEF